MPRFNSWRTNTAKAFELRESRLTLWHSAAFTLNICCPMLLGWLFYDAKLGPLGGIMGLLLSLSDAPTKLSNRIWLLARAALTVCFFGLIGSHSPGNSPIFWTLLVALTCGAGWFSLAGNNIASALRYGALALISASSSGELGVSAIVLLGFATVICALIRAAGHVIFRDDSPVLPAAQPKERPRLEISLRYCCIYAAAVAAGLILGAWQGAHRPLWVATTVLLVMQPDPQSSYQRILQRLLGTAVGVVAAAFIVHFVHSETLLALAVAVIASMLPHGATRNYWIQSAFTAGLVLVLMDFAISGQDFDVHLLSERIRDVVIGCAIAVMATILAFPPSFRKSQPVEDAFQG